MLPRLILIGASNVANCMPTIVQSVRALWRQPVEILAAMGHGRSFALRTMIPFRKLPGIRDSGLWEALESSCAADSAAVITDVGNDLLYGIPPQGIVRWVKECCERVEPYAERRVLVTPPAASVERLGPLRYRLFRTLLFPGCGLKVEQAIEHTRRLADDLQAIGAERGWQVVRPELSWYGFDPIHIRYGARQRIWDDLLARLAPSDGISPVDQTPTNTPLMGWRETLKLWWLKPHRSWILGRERTTEQPAAILRDGVRVSFY